MFFRERSRSYGNERTASGLHRGVYPSVHVVFRPLAVLSFPYDLDLSLKNDVRGKYCMKLPGAVKQFLQQRERSSVISCMKHV